ncbi:septum formation initiator family protein [Candidatus Saccharibacteria bacterium]|nr:septum formation initiator family protein [Candidatus Saccharibacteria bacterium]
MLSKIKKLQQSSLYYTLTDVRTLGLIVFTIMALLVTWSGIKVVQTNYDLQKQMSAMQQRNQVRQLENSNLALKNLYLETDQYIELVVRRQYNKASPGEKLLIVPKTVAMSHTVDVELPEVRGQSTGLEDTGPWYERNFNAWLEFLFRREG